MKFYSRSQFASWFEGEIKKYVGNSRTSWVGPIEYEKAAKEILRNINNQILVPNPYGWGGWNGVYSYGERIWDKNRIWLDNIEISVSNSGSYVSSKGSYSQKYSSSTTQSDSFSSNSSTASGIIKRHNFDSSLRKIQEFSNQVPRIPELEKFETDGGLFGWGDHYVNGSEMNKYVEKVQDIFKTHNGIIIKTIKEFKDIYSTFDYLDREYLTGIVQSATAAAKASEGARTASNQAKVASEQAKAAADKALKNEEDLKKDVENLRKLVEKIRSIKEELSIKIENTNTSLSQKIQKVEQGVSTQFSLKDEHIRSIKKDLSAKIENTNTSLSQKIQKIEQDISTQLSLNDEQIQSIKKDLSAQLRTLSQKIQKIEEDISTQRSLIEELKSALTLQETQDLTSSDKKIRAEVIWAYIIGGMGLICSICSFIFR